MSDITTYLLVTGARNRRYLQLDYAMLKRFTPL